MPVGEWTSVRSRTNRRLEAEMSQISEGSALVLALACALWIYEVTKVIHAQRNRLIDLPVRARDFEPYGDIPESRTARIQNSSARWRRGRHRLPWRKTGRL